MTTVVPVLRVRRTACRFASDHAALAFALCCCPARTTIPPGPPGYLCPNRAVANGLGGRRHDPSRCVQRAAVPDSTRLGRVALRRLAAAVVRHAAAAAAAAGAETRRGRVTLRRGAARVDRPQE